MKGNRIKTISLGSPDFLPGVIKIEASLIDFSKHNLSNLLIRIITSDA